MGIRQSWEFPGNQGTGLPGAHLISRSKQFIKKKKVSGKFATKIFCNYGINNYVQSLLIFRSCLIYLSWKMGVKMAWAQFWGASGMWAVWGWQLPEARHQGDARPESKWTGRCEVSKPQGYGPGICMCLCVGRDQWLKRSKQMETG